MRTVHLVVRDLHSGFVVPSGEICEYIPELGVRFDDAPYLEFGWGDRRYYQSETSSLVAKLLAVLIPSDSTIQVVAVNDQPSVFYNEEPVVQLVLTDKGYEALIHFISNSFDRNRLAGLTVQASGRHGDSQFYKAKGFYHLFNTCNTWTAKGLYTAGIDINPRRILTVDDIMAVANRLGRNNANL